VCAIFNAVFNVYIYKNICIKAYFKDVGLLRRSLLKVSLSYLCVLFSLRIYIGYFPICRSLV